MKYLLGKPMMIVLATLATLTLSAAICQAQAPEAATAPEFTPERLTGRIVNTGSGAGSYNFTLQINDLSSDEEIAELQNLLKESGYKDVLKVMEKMEPNGWVRIGDDLRVNVAVIRSIPTEAGRLIRAVTYRTLHFTEEMEATRSRKYRFGMVDILLDADGAGEGTVFVAARFMFNKDGGLEVESYGIAPVKVLNMQAKPHGGQ
jgi:hypothetical protein